MQKLRQKIWLNSLATAYLLSFIFSSFFFLGLNTQSIINPVLESPIESLSENFLPGFSEAVSDAFISSHLDERDRPLILNSNLRFVYRFVITISDLLSLNIDLPPPAV